MKETKKWYNLDPSAVSDILQTDIDVGLHQKERQQRLESSGPNELPEKERIPEWIKFLKHFNDILIYILFLAAIITFLLDHRLDTAVIIVVALINAIIGYVQENRAEKELDNIKNLLSSNATIISDDHRHEVDAKELVQGDIVVLNAGDKIPADIRLTYASNFKVEESALTGESTSVEKSTIILDEDTVLGDRINMVFSGTSVASGYAVGIVVETAEQTELGKINQSISEVEAVKTPLLEQTEKLGKMISVAIVFLAILTYIYGYFFGNYDAYDLILYVIGMAVGAIPEGLPAILSIILSIGVRSMANHNAIVKNLPSVETLGAVSVIASDKTGTLTKNEMTVTTIILENETYEVTGTGYAPEGEIKSSQQKISLTEHPTLLQFLSIAKTVNTAHIKQDDEGHWTITGDPTEGCLITLSEKAEHEIPRHEIISKIPFDSSYKYMAALVETEGEKMIWVKGAPDRLLDLSFSDAENEQKNFWNEKMTERAKEGERVIAMAYKPVEKQLSEINHDDLKEGLQIVGMAGIIDPPREDAIEAIIQAQSAGIQVKMITGDHKETALAIGKQMGITHSKEALTGKEIDELSEEELKEVVLDYDVYARTSPENKVDLVKAMQANELTVAMTGDGVNDAPALKRADIGVAMGIKGTEVAKESSEMILVDDHFRTIFEAVKEGRLVYDNLKKSILFILPTNGAEALLTFLSILLGISMPLSPIQILWINMVTSVTISLALAFEKLEPGTMKKPPRPKQSHILSRYYLFRIFYVSFLVGGSVLLMNTLLLQNGYEQNLINTVTFQSIVISQIFYLFNSRKELDFAFGENFFSNKSVFYVSALLVLMQLGVSYLPIMNTILGTIPIDGIYWLIPIVIGTLVFVVVELEKWVTRTILSKR